MKKIIYILSIAFAAFVVGSCEKASADKTLETEYFTLNGDMAMYVEMGDPYVEPGYTPCEGASDVEVYIIDPNGSLVDEVDTSESGFYQIVYCNTSKEGFYFEKSRMVYVYDPTIEVDMAGGYSLDAKTSLFAGDTYLEYAQYNSDQSNFDPSVQAWARAPFVTPSVSITISKVAGNMVYGSDADSFSAISPNRRMVLAPVVPGAKQTMSMCISLTSSLALHSICVRSSEEISPVMNAWTVSLS